MAGRKSDGASARPRKRSMVIRGSLSQLRRSEDECFRFRQSQHASATPSKTCARQGSSRRKLQCVTDAMIQLLDDAVAGLDPTVLNLPSIPRLGEPRES
jgi:hypothetical protein